MSKAGTTSLFGLALVVRWHKTQWAARSADARERRPEILAFLQSGITNAGTGATNRTVKTAARTAYGFRNLAHQRRRVRLASTRRSRQATAC